ncbi:MAG TPA: hypothetical protein VF041_09785 [Gemmatimonadaceae bacterium]
MGLLIGTARDPCERVLATTREEHLAHAALAALAMLVGAITAGDARGVFRHCGYARSARA